MHFTRLRLLIVMVICSTACTLALAADDKAKDAGDDDPAKSSLKNSVPAAAFDAVPLKDVVKFVADVGKANVYLDRPALEAAGIDAVNARVTINLQADGTVETVLKSALATIETKETPVTFAPVGNVIVISTGPGVKDFVKRHRKALARAESPGWERLGRPLPEVPLDAVRLVDTIEFLRDVTTLNISVDWEKLETVGVTRDTPITLRLRHTAPAQVLQLVLDECWPTKALGFEMKDGVVHISTAPGEKDPPPRPKNKPPAAGKQGL